MSSKNETKNKTSVIKFFLGHEKPNRTDLIELAIAAVFVIYLAFFVLKTHKII